MAGNGQYNHNSRIDHIKDYFLRRNYLVLDTRSTVPDLIIFKKGVNLRFVEVETKRSTTKINKYKKLKLEQYLMLQKAYTTISEAEVRAIRSIKLKHLNENKRIGKIKAQMRLNKSLLPEHLA